MKKVLIVRFSSIGDIVLTTPVVRCIKQQLGDVELHYLTKKTFQTLLEANPDIDKIYSIDKNLSEITPLLREEKYTHIIDLHKNLRTLQLRIMLWKKFSSFNKLNFRKFLAVRLKWINLLPAVHIVDRYFKAVKVLGVTNDGKGLDYFIPKDMNPIPTNIANQLKEDYVAIVVGSKHTTKQLPAQKLIEIGTNINKHIALLGGKDDIKIAEEICKQLPHAVNCCGLLSLHQSAYLVKNASSVLTNDTGLMHIAAAFHKKIISVWGNTIPEFGMYPYLPESIKELSTIIEIKGLSCRPCSKIGYNNCPKGHFNCMNQMNSHEISKYL
ncbi:MAG: glycosyltransferase family 9 protein [Bacteroidota bacterium]